MSLESILQLSFDYWQQGEKTLQMIHNELTPMLEQSFRQYLTTIVASFQEFQQFTHVQQYFIIGGMVQEILAIFNQNKIYHS